MRVFVAFSEWEFLEGSERKEKSLSYKESGAEFKDSENEHMKRSI